MSGAPFPHAVVRFPEALAYDGLGKAWKGAAKPGRCDMGLGSCDVRGWRDGK